MVLTGKRPAPGRAVRHGKYRMFCTVIAANSRADCRPGTAVAVTTLRAGGYSTARSARCRVMTTAHRPGSPGRYQICRCDATPKPARITAVAVVSAEGPPLRLIVSPVNTLVVDVPPELVSLSFTM